MPAVGLIDLRRDRPPRGGWLAPGLRAALTATLEAGEQALLFLNRRGFAPLTLCRACGIACAARTAAPGWSATACASACYATIAVTAGPSSTMPDCGAVDALIACGPGVERLAHEVRSLWPDARSAILTSDSPASPSAAAELLKAMRAHRLDLLIGTQIIAKGHHFPDLTLVGVVDGDLGLAGGDLRAAERQFQLLYRSPAAPGGRRRPGRALIQTYLPEHPLMQALAAGDKERFYAEELPSARTPACRPSAASPH